MIKSYKDVRIEYDDGVRLLEENAPANPMALYASWYKDALDANLQEPNAMTLSTVSAEGTPSARTLLLKGADERGFAFFTNYASRKGQALAANPFAAITFFWGQLHRQVCIEGRVDKLSTAESDAYYQSRPILSRLGAWVSPQGQVIPNRAFLEERLSSLQEQYAQVDPERPPHWGGYLLVPTRIEFWQGAPHRLHDRLLYTRDTPTSPDWSIVRLAP